MKAAPKEDAAQVWSLGFQDRASAPSPEQTQRAPHLSGCGIAFLDLVDTSDGESLRLYFDAEVEEGMSEPMSSSLTVLEVPPCVPASDAPTLRALWASTQWAWHPDAAYVCGGRPGHYQGCLVWGNAKTEAVLAALAGAPHCSKALAFTYGSHPLDKSLLGRGPGHTVEVLLQVPLCSTHQDDLWCRLPGAAFSVVPGGVAEHHQRRVSSLRSGSSTASLASGSFGRGCFGAAAAASGPLSSWSSATDAAPSRACSRPAAALDAAGEFAGGGAAAPRPRLLSRLGHIDLEADMWATASSPCCSSGGGGSARASSSAGGSSVGAGSIAGSSSSSSSSDDSSVGEPPLAAVPAPAHALSILSCSSTAASSPSLPPICAGGGAFLACGGSSGSTPAALTPTAAGGSTRRNSRCSDAPASPFALFCEQEYWDDEVVIVAAGGW